ncbi:hypothetical protein LTR36_000872 [Oleoguttula mirabilis]|uniref:Uncharacterized protein n=1 Tax=Oleoguttula mirabilis TaxID=1507867 RepID=A0AAV9J380_9PEZI|nr:hypothetical protein LTR36_000872 [Oleoguttula mirabilis]
MALRRKLGAIAWFGGSLVCDYPLSNDYSCFQMLTRDSVSGVIIARLITPPARLSGVDYSYDAVNFFILISLELHLCIMNAAYVSLLSFINKTTTGFMNTTAAYSSETGPSQHSGVFRQRKSRSDNHNRSTTLAQGCADGTSLKSFDSQAIMVTRSVAIEEDRDRQTSQSSMEEEEGAQQ